MDNREFNRLLDGYLQGRLTNGAKAGVERWLDEQETVNDSDINWTETDKARLLDKINLRVDELEHEEKKATRLRVWMRAGTLALLLLLVSYSTWRIYSNSSSSTRTSKVSAIEKMILADGTIVWLKNRSKLTYPRKFTGKVRHVEVQGEALFEVAENSSHPFMIKSGQLVAKVQGTSLNIKSTAQETEVIVLTGEVSLISPHNKQSVVVRANEKAVYNKETQLIKTTITGEKEKASVTAGTEYSMYFQDSTMKAILFRIESKFDVKISQDGANIDHCRMTADFTDRSLEHTLKMIAEKLQLEYSIKDGTVTISGKGCK